ncbi:MAG: 2-octaprenyl-6-methoxyphenyl hydroxylase [Gammaproteobacteria bacterium]|nr:2-octaprenyl-6-methoxyphenyl hydroxylase [Gammaproteobacteria bacterium]
MATQLKYDVSIIGGGLVGASLAAALSGHGLKVAVLEAFELQSQQQPSYDDRSIALSYGSSRILDSMGIWQQIDQAGVCAIDAIHVSDKGHMGSARMSAHDEAVSALGYVVESRVMGHVFAQGFEQMEDVDLLCPVTLQSMDISDKRVRLLAQKGDKQLDIRSRLVVAADGGQSLVRQWQGIGTVQADYGQTAIIANVTTQRPHQGVAYERFTNTGPLAMLPMTPNMNQSRCSLVWTADNAEVDTIMGWDDTTFARALQERFGHRLGAIEQVGKRSAYPLKLMQVREAIRPRLAVIGNAAHMLHPVAGQGFNLGLRDVSALAQVVVDAHRRGEDFGQMSVLNEYRQWRRKDTVRTLLMTDGLVRSFSTDFTPAALVRNVALLALDAIPFMKRILTRQAMGLNGKQTRLARGLPL